MGKPDGIQRRLQIRHAGQHRVFGSGITRTHHHSFGLELVHGQGRGENSAASVGHSQPFQRALHQSVLAPGSMQRYPHPVECLADQVLNGAILGIEGMGIDAAALQGREYRVAAQQRNLALGGIAAEQYRHLAEIRGRSGRGAGPNS